MERRKKNRIIAILTLLAICTLGVYIILSNLKDNIVFFYPPSEISKLSNKLAKVRVGGLVKEGSINYNTNNQITFILTDYKAEITIIYQGMLPALFRENQGIIAEGFLQNDNNFLAKNLLAKHDENYMPPSFKNESK